MIVEIRNYLAASYLLETEPQLWSAIVILDWQFTASDFVGQHTAEHLVLRFDDITTPRDGKHMVDEKSLQRAFDFASNKEQLIVSCRAGQSRSAALAFAICFQYNGPAAANQLLNPTRHKPNRRIIELASRFVDDPTFLSVFQRWEDQHARIRLMDYMDDIDAEFNLLKSQGARNLIVGPNRAI